MTPTIMTPTATDIAQAIHACLLADVHVTSALGTPPRIYDDVPESPVHPYVSYGALRVEDGSGDRAPFVTATLNIHLYSRYAGKAEAMGLLSLLLAALQRDALREHLPGTVSVLSRYTDSFTARDGRSRHSVLRLSIAVAGEVLEEVA